ncbi:MAG TPA: hypothetical protein VK176_12975, partial [Phycisphaerales bacterium]|nr:hypothetical protein [Phycisphaerales bacterium]
MPQGRTSIIALSAGLTLLAPPALASDLFPPPAPDSAQTTPVPSADIIWQRTIETYRAAVFGERVRISITRPRSPRPGPAGADADRLALEELLTAPGDEQRGVVFLRAAMVPPPPTTSPTTSPEQPTPNEAPAG